MFLLLISGKNTTNKEIGVKILLITVGVRGRGYEKVEYEQKKSGIGCGPEEGWRGRFAILEDEVQNSIPGFSNIFFLKRVCLF